MTRRDALGLLGLAGLSVTTACGSEESESSADGEDELSNPFRCRGGMDRETSSKKAGAAPPELRRYEKIVLLMMENRSFDHYFGHLSLPTSLGGEGRTDVEGLRGDEIQILSREPGDREEFRPFHAQERELGDIEHDWAACHLQFNGGAMDGFIRAHYEDLERVRAGSEKCGGSVFRHKCAALRDPMAYYRRADTPIFHQLFDNYALCDRWFSSVMGPTWPNRHYLHAATSCGITSNAKMRTAKNPQSADEARTIWHELDAKCISAVNYSLDICWAQGGFGALNNTMIRCGLYKDSTFRYPVDRPPASWNTSSFEEACQEGCLPTISIIDPGFITTPCDDHPPHDIKAGQAFVASIYKMLASNPEQWRKTLFIITYDEHGSFYDHVSPPRVTEEKRAEFQQLGFRVPALVVGPYVKKNHVSHVQYDHISFLSTATRRFGLTPLNERVAKANDVRDCIDMNRVESRHSEFPITLQRVELSERRVHDSIRESPGQPELALLHYGRPATVEEKRIATDRMLAVFDRLGVANVRR